MINIYCTKKLEKIIGKTNISEVESESFLGNWNANVFYVNRKKFIFMINDQTCYSIIIPNFLKKDFKKFRELFFERLFEQFQYDRIDIPPKIKKKLKSLHLNFLKTNNNRKILGTMTQFIKDLEYYLYYHHERLTLNELNGKLNDNYVGVFGDKKHDIESTIKLMQNLLEETKEKV